MTGSRPKSAQTTAETSARRRAYKSAQGRAYKSAAGLTLVEVMAAILILAIVVIGASGYRYYSALDAKRAEMQSAASRVGLLLCENWRGRGYDRTGNFDPVAHLSSQVEIYPSDVGPSGALGFALLGKYEVVVDNVHYWAALSSLDVAGTDPPLRMLNVVVAWAQRQVGSPDDDPVMDKRFKLTTYVSG